MAVSVMKKLTLIVPKTDADAMLRRLMWLSCVEVESGLAEEGLRPVVCENDRIRLERNVQRLGAAVKTLTRYGAVKRGLLYHRPTVERGRFEEEESAYEEALQIAGDTAGALNRIAELYTEKQRLELQLTALTPWVSYEMPLHMTRTRETRIELGVLPANASVEEAAAKLGERAAESALETVYEDYSGRYVCAVYHQAVEEAVRTTLAQAGFTRIDFSGFDGTAVEWIGKTERAIAACEEKRAAEEAGLTALAQRLPEVELAYDVMQTRLAGVKAKQNVMQTQETAVLTGWVPAKATDKLEAALKETLCWYSLTEPEEGDNVPVLLRNREPASSFESIIGLYSLPAYNTFDPTWILSIFYFVIFGLMLGDAVYGLLLTVGGFLAVRFLDLNAGVKNMVRMFAICGIACTISGVIFGSYFGDFPATFMRAMLGVEIGSPALWFDPISDPITYLVIALVIGVLHLFAGMGIQFYIVWSSGRPFAAIFDVGSWFVLFIGIGLYALVPAASMAGLYVAAAGVLMLVLSQGRNEKNVFMKIIKGVGSLYGIVNYGSDLLSYSRIMALGMASAVIASVINILATLIGPSVVGYIAMTAILLFGHTVNLAINLLGSFVHTSRLQYIEFFGKFYTDGGRPFRPVRAETKYTHIR